MDKKKYVAPEMKERDYMNKEEFFRYIADNIMDYLPPSYDSSTIELEDFVKNNRCMTCIIIHREGETIVPRIVLDSLYEEYQEGRNIDEVVGDVADRRIEFDMQEGESLNIQKIMQEVREYEKMKDNLEIHLCGRTGNENYLESMVYTEYGDFAATYFIKLGHQDEEVLCAGITPELLKYWGIDVRQLHNDAMKADLRKEPVLYNVDSLITEMTLGRNTENLLDNPEIYPFEQPMLYCLTNKEKTHGASMLLQTDILKKAGEVIGDNYYVLPSSIHESLLVPEHSGMTVDELSQMVREINRNEVLPEERLSDYVQHYDRETGVLENAYTREKRILKAQKESDPIKEALRRSAQRYPKSGNSLGLEM